MSVCDRHICSGFPMPRLICQETSRCIPPRVHSDTPASPTPPSDGASVDDRSRILCRSPALHCLDHKAAALGLYTPSMTPSRPSLTHAPRPMGCICHGSAYPHLAFCG